MMTNDKRYSTPDQLGFSLAMVVFLFPFSYHLIEFHTSSVRIIFSTIALGLAEALGFHPLLSDLSSDSIGLYFHVFAVLILSLPLFWVLNRSIVSFQKTGILFRSFLAWFLAFILLRYGIDKLFLKQFPEPEPNLLYTPLGNMDKDILFWTSMGTSVIFNIVTGIIEVITSVLLIVRKTRTIGVVFSTGIFLQILIINLSFDISVKLFSTLLLIIAFYLAYPGLQKIWTILISHKSVSMPTDIYNVSVVPKSVRIIFSFLLLTEALYPHLPIRTPLELTLQGGYACLDDTPEKIRRIFIHSEGYLIFQNDRDELVDYSAQINTTRNRIQLSDYDGHKRDIGYHWDNKKEILFLYLNSGKPPVRFIRIEHKALPLLKDSFHFIVDQEVSFKV